MSGKFTLSGFSDEITKDIDGQFAGLNKLGIQYFEPRSIGEKNIIKLTDAETENLRERMTKAQIQVSSIGSPIGKIKITDDFEVHFEEFKRTVQIAKMLDCRYIRMFSFFVDEASADAHTDKVVEKLSRMVAYAEKEDVVLLHENEKGIYGNIARRCRTLFERIQSEHFKAVFDFSNFVECSQDTLEAYELLKEHIAYVHIKDCIHDKGVVPAGMGDGNLKAILGDLYNRGYNGFLSLEPHLTGYTLPDEATCGELVMSFEDGAPRKFAYAHKALTELLAEIVK
ncbi:MAG: sugar phosphate isomerase/epimerase family protein [Eubacteriales bacterium]